MNEFIRPDEFVKSVTAAIEKACVDFTPTQKQQFWKAIFGAIQTQLGKFPK